MTEKERSKVRVSHRRKSRVRASTVVLFIALVICLSTAIGGTMAWIITRTDPIVNTFTYGDINITLTETDTGKDGDGDNNTNRYEMMPGKTIEKDPKVTVRKGSKDNWLFVKLEKSDNFDSFMEYSMAGGWNQLFDDAGKPVEGVFWRSVSEADVADDDKEFGIILNNQVKVKDTVTKEQLNGLDETDPPVYPTLSITAYAVQRDEGQDAINTAWKAWELANPAGDAAP